MAFSAVQAFSSILTKTIAEGTLISAQSEFLSWVPWSALVLIVITAIWSTAYLNAAMMQFGNNEVIEADSLHPWVLSRRPRVLPPH